MHKYGCLFFLAASLISVAEAQSHKPLLMRDPSVSKTQIVFSYAGDLWLVARDGGKAQRLTSGAGRELHPIFSPDGNTVAFTGEYDGNLDVYTVPVTGGTPKRLTYHPSPDMAVAWAPDGKRILFHSNRGSAVDGDQLYTIAVDGAFPEMLPLPIGEDGSYSADGSRLAYVPLFQWQAAWKKYRGGQTKKIWIADLADSSVVKIPRENSNDFNPMWVGDKIYFLSDRSGATTLFEYGEKSHKITQVVKNDGLDMKSASAGPDAIVYEQFGRLCLFDSKSGKTHSVDVEIAGEFEQVRPHFQKLIPKDIVSSQLSPTGQRAVFEAHGEIMSVPADKGDVRNLTATPAVAERDPSWSPDGKSIAYFSDEGGEYQLHIRDQNGLGAVRKIALGQPPSFFYSPVWSPDSKKIAYSDKRLQLWYVDLSQGTPVKIDTDLYDSPGHRFDQSWSPDSRWLTYTKQLHNHLHAIFAYSLPSSKVTQVTDGMSDCLSPNFDKNGKYLYFIASTNVGLSSGWIDMSSDAHPVTSSVYVAVLRKDLPSPLAPESDEEKAAEKDKDKNKAEESKGKPVAETNIEFDKIDQRILALPIAPQNYQALLTAKEGVLFLIEAPIVNVNQNPEAPSFTVQKFDLKTRKTDKFMEGAEALNLSADGEKVLLKQHGQWFITASAGPPKPGEGLLKTADMEVYVDPCSEWKQMYDEVWRIQRDFFYDPNLHGLNRADAEKFYGKYLNDVRSRDDLNYLFEEMLGNITVGHMFIRGGTAGPINKIKGGLLGADYKVENGRYRFAKVFDGENWNPGLQAPLTQPGVNVSAGDYLLAVRGKEVHATDNIYSFFEETAGKQIVLKVGPNADGTKARDVTVVPIENETGLRHLAWVEGNRRKVDQLSGGRVAYVHLPDTGAGGFNSFNRYFFAQVDHQAAVLDERYNHGGQIADYILDSLRRPMLGRITTREGEDVPDPGLSIYGPKVMIINQFAGSGGDAMPWYFRKSKIGPLVGMKTWGGLVGIGGYPQLMDGGTVMAPRWAFYGLDGQWEVENHGIAPDIEIDADPKLVREGHDPQLEKAVDVVLELLKKNPLPTYQRPAYPNYHQVLPSASSE